MIAGRWKLRQKRGIWFAEVLSGRGAPVGRSFPVVLVHPKGDERGSGFEGGRYRAVPNDHGAWWLSHGFAEALAHDGMTAVRRSAGHDPLGSAKAGGAWVGVFSVDGVAYDERELTFRRVERIAEITD